MKRSRTISSSSRSSIEALESRELFSGTITPEFIGHTLAVRPQQPAATSFVFDLSTTPPTARQQAAAAPSVSEVVVTKAQQPQPQSSSFSWGANQTATGFQWGVGRGVYVEEIS
jgi:hypothetical protein